MNILITGTSSGFGKEMAIALAASGHTIYAGMRCINGKNKVHAEQLEALSLKLSGQIVPLDIDVNSDKSVEDAIVTMQESISTTLDVVINNAGRFIGGLNETFTPSQVEHLFNTNLLGPLRVMRAVLPAFRNQGKGTIINVTSSISRFVLPGGGLYTASKSALETVTESYAYELAPLGIEALILQPGSFNTGIMDKSQGPDESERAGSYHATLNHMEAMNERFMGLIQDSFFNLSPKVVAEAVIALLDQPYGNRPLRTLVDPSALGEQAAEINQRIDDAQHQLLRSLKVEQMAKVEK